MASAAESQLVLRSIGGVVPSCCAQRKVDVLFEPTQLYCSMYGCMAFTMYSHSPGPRDSSLEPARTRGGLVYFGHETIAIPSSPHRWMPKALWAMDQPTNYSLPKV